MDAAFPDVGRATARLLRRLGHEVEFPLRQTCCGQMHLNAGYQRDALPLIEHFVKTFGGYDAVVAPSGSCVASVRHQHPTSPSRQSPRSWRERRRASPPAPNELSQFLVDVLGVEDVGAYFPHRVTYHPSCHSLRLLRVGDRPLRLLRRVRGLELVELPQAESC